MLPRRPESRPSTTEGRAQSPTKRFTPEQLRAMMQSGQLGGQTAPRSSAPGSGRGGSAPSRPGSAPSTGPAPPGGRRAGYTEESEDERKGKGPTTRLGSIADRGARRAKRVERANERRTITSPVSVREITGDDDDSRRSRGPRRSGRARGGAAVIAPRKTRAIVEPPVSVRALSEATGIKSKDFLQKLFASGQLYTINSILEDELAMELAMEFGVELEVSHERTVEQDFEDLFATSSDVDAGRVLRPPVITILGHVDHGKTSLLDKIRRANVVDTESGGITQHIGAYQVEHQGHKITFVDTPGHEAFTAMRARGANVTDIVVLVVAADDGIMPQTREAIAHAKAAEVPVVVALNKIDLPNVESTANINKIYGELAQEGLNPVEWGGDTEVIRTSATSGRGIPELLQTLDTLAELLELSANPGRPGSGTCLESSISEGRGVVATVLVQEGTLRVGDTMVCGSAFGRVRALFDDRGRPVAEAPPSTPVEVSGLDEVPQAGEKFAAITEISSARSIAEARRGRSRGESLANRTSSVTLENLFDKMTEQKLKCLNLILKADVQGSLEALVKELDKLENPEVPIRILHKAVGGISESDVILADASQAIILGFRVAPEDRATSLAEEKSIDVRRYDIIYQVTDEIKKAVEGLLVPEVKEVHIGRATVRQVFKISKIGTVAGCIVTQGSIERNAKARIIREGREIYKGTIEALKRFKDDVREVREGFECGIRVSNYDDVKVDDTIEAYRVDVIRRTL
jgi:translation initiation factor IF-2